MKRNCCLDRCESLGLRHFKPSEIVREGVRLGYEIGLFGANTYSILPKAAPRGQFPVVMNTAQILENLGLRPSAPKAGAR